ncbi:MAG: tripartite tricarboxylate transporter TctB family protein [Spirochaetales bacterium]|jgi:putative tricarboxylic transport membrane protein|nr:tripartite tricarboxylate transporter TctB family protein [Spirochaetales bacterium]
MPYRKNIIAGGALCVFAILYLLLSLRITIFTGLGAAPLDSRFIPRLWGVCLLALSVSLLLRGMRERKVYLKAGKTGAPAFSIFSSQFFRKNYAVILTFVMIAVYTALIGIIGFIVMSALYLFGQMMILTPPGKRNPLLAGIVALVVSVALDYVFVSLLHVLLPRGIFGF